jgi:hypothetical protein
MKITEEVSEILKSYVYIYIDPRNGEPFYIGKGQGNRVFTHLDDQSESEKVVKIIEIKIIPSNSRYPCVMDSQIEPVW